VPSSGRAPVDSSSTVAFLGPEGTFTEQALRRRDDLREAYHLACNSMVDVLYAVADGEADLGVVPIENAIEGTVNATIDTLAFDLDLHIHDEMLEPVHMNLLARRGASVDTIDTVLSIPVATAQCRIWLRKNLPIAEFLTASSTAAAASSVAHEATMATAAIGNDRAAEVYGLEILAAGIEDHPENQTRFIVVGRDGVPAPTGHDKTSIVVFQRADRPGSLLAILQEFAARSINLSLLLSRPTKTSLGDYCFVLEMHGHVADPVVADCLQALKATQAEVKFLGSFPAAGSSGDQKRTDVSEAQSSAAEWMDRIRAQVADA
jgi:prephenate dehydratase